MIAPIVLRLVVLTLTAAVVFLTGLSAGASPGGTREDSLTTERRDLFVQECDGFDAFTGYTVTRDYRTVTDHAGDLVYERRHVSFSGAFANGETGRAMPYQGAFTRFADYEQGRIVIADISVHLELPDGGELTYSVDRRDRDLTDDPLVVLRALAGYATATGLCDILAGVPNVDPADPLDLLGPASEEAAPYRDLCGTERAGTAC